MRNPYFAFFSDKNKNMLFIEPFEPDFTSYEASFYKTAQEAELDLVLVKGNKK